MDDEQTVYLLVMTSGLGEIDAPWAIQVIYLLLAIPALVHALRKAWFAHDNSTTKEGTPK